MKKIITVILALITVLVMLFASGCAEETNEPIKPPVDFVKARTYDGKGIVVMVMRTWDNALSLEEINEIKSELFKEIPEYKPEGGVVALESTPVFTDGRRVLAYGYAVYTDKIAKPSWWIAGNEKSGEPLYSRALKWYVRELAGLDNTNLID